MTLFSHFLRYHHSDKLDVSITLLDQEPDPDLILRKELDWIERIGTVVPGGLNNRPVAS